VPTIVQLDEMLEKSNSKLTAALEFEIDDEIVLDRLGGRYVHPASGRSYHVKYAPPKVAGKDDVRLFLHHHHHPFFFYFFVFFLLLLLLPSS
jgi:adenylate kinase family enzyme